MQNIYVITETTFDDEQREIIKTVIAFTDRSQAEKFVVSGRENDQQRFYELSCVTLI